MRRLWICPLLNAIPSSPRSPAALRAGIDAALCHRRHGRRDRRRAALGQGPRGVTRGRVLEERVTRFQESLGWTPRRAGDGPGQRGQPTQLAEPGDVPDAHPPPGGAHRRRRDRAECAHPPPRRVGCRTRLRGRCSSRGSSASRHTWRRFRTMSRKRAGSIPTTNRPSSRRWRRSTAPPVSNPPAAAGCRSSRAAINVLIILGTPRRQSASGLGRRDRDRVGLTGATRTGARAWPRSARCAGARPRPAARSAATSRVMGPRSCAHAVAPSPKAALTHTSGRFSA